MSQVSVKRDSSPMCVYIAARGHSGSTILELLLNRYPELAAVGEVDQLPLQIVRDGIQTKWEGLCSCKKRPWACDIWQAVLDQVSSEFGVDLLNSPFDLPVSDVGLAQEYGRRRPMEYFKYSMHRAIRHATYRLGSNHSYMLPYRTWVRNRDAIYRALASKHAVTAIVDSSKDPLQMSDLYRYSELPVKVLFLTRDVRGNAWSAIRTARGSAAAEAKDWVSVNGQILSRLSDIPKSSWMQVKYEDICADTSGTLRSIRNFLDIRSDPISPTEELARRHTIAGNRVRFAKLESIRHDLSWQNNLSKRQMSEIWRIAGPVARALNYEI